jgi:hypothetical protein
VDAFSYLSVLLSIIIGLAIAQVLQGYRALLLARDRVRLNPAPLLWSLLMLVAATQNWWASFGLREHADWTFVEFAIVLVQMMLLYMGTAVILPDVPPGEQIDLDQHFDRQRVPFFSFLLALLVVSIIKDVVIDGELPDSANLLFHAVLGSISFAAMLVRSRPVQTGLAVAAASGFAMYIAVLFATL